MKKKLNKRALLFLEYVHLNRVALTYIEVLTRASLIILIYLFYFILSFSFPYQELLLTDLEGKY